MREIIHKINFEKTYYYTLILFAFLLPLSRAANSFFIIFLIILLLLQGEYKKHFTVLKTSTFVKAIAGFIGFMMLSLLWTENIQLGLDPKMLYIEWIAIFAIALNIQKKQIPTIISAFILGMIISEILSYGMFLEWWQFKGHGKEYPSPFMMHIDYSVFLAFTAILLLNRFLSKQYNSKEKMLILFLFLFTTAALFINTGRTGQVGFLAGLITMIFLRYKLNIRSIGLSILSIGIIFGAAYTVSDKFQERINFIQKDLERMKKGEFYTSGGLRVAMYIVANDIVKENPLIGVGVGDYNIAAQEALEKDDHHFIPEVVEFIGSNHFHNQYLNILIQAGFIGLILFLMLCFQFAKLSIADEELKNLSILFLVIFMTSFLMEPLLFKQFTNTLFILFTGLFLGIALQPSALSALSKSK